MKSSPDMIPANWQPNALFINEPGFYALFIRSKLPAAEKFRVWLFEEVLPSLRQTGEYKIDATTLVQESWEYKQMAASLVAANNALAVSLQNTAKAHECAELAYRDAAKAHENYMVLSHRLADIAVDVITKPKSKDLLHSLSIHSMDDGQFVFTRCQRRSLAHSLKRLTTKCPNAKEIYRNSYVPNSVNILNCVKDWLKESKLPYRACNNILNILGAMDSDELVSFVRNIIAAERIASM